MSRKSKMPRGELEQILTSRTCPVCSEKFVTMHPAIYAYKIAGKSGTYKYFCRYRCMRTFQKQQEKVKNE